MNSEGIGLGLTIVKQIIESSEGQIEVKSMGVGFGSVFAFTMKMATSSEAISIRRQEEH